MPLKFQPSRAPAAHAGAAAAVPDLPARVTQLLDAEALARLQALDPGGRSGLLPRVLATFESSGRRLLDQLHDARGRADPGGVRHVAHTLKSSAASVGALELSALCADIERRAHTDDFGALQAPLDAMVTEARRVFDGLQACAADPT